MQKTFKFLIYVIIHIIFYYLKYDRSLKIKLIKF